MFCGLAHPILKFMNTPEDIYNEAYEYMFIVLLGSGATFLQYDIQYTAGSWRQPDAPVLSGIFLLLNIVLISCLLCPLKAVLQVLHGLLFCPSFWLLYYVPFQV